MSSLQSSSGGAQLERKTLQYGQFRGVQKWLKNHCCYNVTFILAENVGKTAIARSVLTVGAPAVLHGSLGRKIRK